MKKITLFLFLLTFSLGFSQNAPIDFEVGGNGANWTWTVTEDGTNPALELVDNPNTTGINTSAKAAKMITEIAGNPWALTFSDDIGTFTFDASNSVVKMMVRKDVATNVGLKFEGTSAAKEILKPSVVVNGDWEELTFDFTSVIGSTYNRIVIIPDFAARTQDHVVYFDNITFGSGGSAPVFRSTPITFEPKGSTWIWMVDQDGTNPALGIVDNPNMSSPNTSSKVAMFTAQVAGAPWALVISDDIGSFKFDNTNSLVKMMVRKSVASNVGVKFEGPGVAKEVLVANTVTNGDWEELTFDFSSEEGKTFNKLVIIPDFAPRTTENIVYFDNLSFNAQGGAGTDSNTVTVDVAAAWRGYMNVFNTSGGFEFGDGWGVPELKTTIGESNIILQPNYNTYTNALLGSDADRAYWTNSTNGGATPGPIGNKNMAASTYVEPGASFNGKDLTFTGNVVSNTLKSDYTAEFFITALDPNAGYVDTLLDAKVFALPASGTFSVSATAAELAPGLIIQYGFVIKGLNGNPVDAVTNGNVVVGAASLSTKSVALSKFVAYPNPTQNNWTISSPNFEIATIQVFDVLGKNVMTLAPKSNQVTIDATQLNSGLYFARINAANGSSTLKLVKK